MKRAKTIMLQGTASGVGKSTLAIGLCRIFARKGCKVAPFKAQNLSDNAHLLPDGRQMARSQAIAAACKITPTSEMNPVLLKFIPGGCETIVNGKVTKNPGKEQLRNEVWNAYERLSSEYDVIVAEGAGSPVELNLKSGDIVNMNFAVKADCPVILAADIRRGGMFASVYGTLALLEPNERALVRGIIVNDFYGDPASFAEGVRILEEITNIPVLGVIPHLELHLEDEDSLQGSDTQTRERIAALIPEGMTFEEYQMQQFDLLADELEKYLDLPAIRVILEGDN